MRAGIVASVVGVLFVANGLASGHSPGEVPAALFEFEWPTSADVLLTQGSMGMTAPAQPAAGSGPAGGGAAQEDNGTNPAKNTTTFIVSDEYYTLDGGNRINTTYARLKFPVYGGRGSLLFETPFVYYNFLATAPNLPQIGGLGDIKEQGSFNSWTFENKKLTLINFGEMFLPTADNAIVTQVPLGNEITAFNLDTGKYVAGVGTGFVYAFCPNFIVAPRYFYEASIFGNEDRPDIRRGKWRIFAMYAWESGIYTLPEFQILTKLPDRQQRYLRRSRIRVQLQGDDILRQARGRHRPEPERPPVGSGFWRESAVLSRPPGPAMSRTTVLPIQSADYASHAKPSGPPNVAVVTSSRS